MSKVDVIMPQMGESITEGTIVKWHKKPGDKVKKEETLLEISTDKVDSEIPAPASGVLTQIVIPEQKTVSVRTVIAHIETDEAVAKVEPTPSEAPEADTKREPKEEAPIKSPESEGRVDRAVRQPAAAGRTVGRDEPTGARFYSPLVMTIAREEGISMNELESISGTGFGGRVTKKDILTYVQSRTGGAAVRAPQPRTIETTLKAVDSVELRKKYPAPQHEILQMTPALQKMAEHMLNSVQTSPHVAAISEADATAVVELRARHAESFEKKERFKLTFMPFVVDAVIRSLKDFPLVNSMVEGDKIIRKKFINLGIAVASENGLIVPVIKNAEEKNFLGLARAINDLATRTRSKKLQPDDVQGGTFTLTNYGVFGNILGAPIINQPQLAILGIGAVKKRPVVINDAIAIRSMMYLTLTFDHRIIDGALGGMFLERIVKYLQEFTGKQMV